MKWFFLCLIGVAAITGVLLPWSHVPQLLSEGYPSATLPARGDFFVLAKGRATKAFSNVAPVSALSPQLAQLFDESGGFALLVLRQGQIELSSYNVGVTRETRFNSFSMVKSLVGVLVLKAVAEGRLTSLEIPLTDILTDLAEPSLAHVTLRDLLEMKSGIMFETEGTKQASGIQEKDLEASIANPFGPMARLHVGDLNAVRSKLTSDAARRGTFSYQNINTALLGAVLESVYGQDLSSLVEEKIWLPAGGGEAQWRRHGPSGPTTAYCCLYATAEDWAHIGYFLMHNGASATPFLPQKMWNELMGAVFSDKERSTGVYGLHVRHDMLDRSGEGLQGGFTYFMGQGGQVVYLVPQADLVVVRFGEQHQLLHSTLYDVGRMLNIQTTPRKGP